MGWGGQSGGRGLASAVWQSASGLADHSVNYMQTFTQGRVIGLLKGSIEVIFYVFFWFFGTIRTHMGPYGPGPGPYEGEQFWEKCMGCSDAVLSKNYRL